VLASARQFVVRHVRAIIGSLVLLVAFGWVLRAGGLPLVPPAGALKNLDLTYFAGFVLLMFAHMGFRFARYSFLIRSFATVGIRRVLTINAIALALITFLPLRLGEVSRPAMLRERGHISAWAVAGTVGAERVIDGVLFSLMLLLGSLIAVPHEPLPTHIGDLPIPPRLVTQGGRVAGLIFGAAFLVMALFYWYRAFARRMTEKVVGIVSQRLAERVADIVGRLSDGLRFLVNPRDTALYLVVSLLSIAANVWAIQLLAHATGIPELTFAQSTVVLGLLALGFGLPNAPGFFGSVQLALYAGLAAYIAPDKVSREGSALVFLFYLTYLAIVVLLAAVSVVVEYAPGQKTAESQSVSP
jgi:glycosyltransferase 2 family protein